MRFDARAPLKSVQLSPSTSYAQCSITVPTEEHVNHKRVVCDLAEVISAPQSCKHWVHGLFPDVYSSVCIAITRAVEIRSHSYRVS